VASWVWTFFQRLMYNSDRGGNVAGMGQGCGPPCCVRDPRRRIPILSTLKGIRAFFESPDERFSVRSALRDVQTEHYR